jgi:DNA-binding IclR family transcriptional regulator
MSSLQRMLKVLDAFSPDEPMLTAEQIIAKFNYSRGTAYRYVRELCETGLLTRIASHYTLGPRVIELDYYIRQSDPILLASKPVMEALRDKLQCDILLTSFYENRIVVTHHERGDDRLKVSYGRGRVMPLFYGAGSKVILASLPLTKQKRLFNAHQQEIAAAGLGDEWPVFRAKLAEIRRTGSAISLGELDAGNVGIAAPIFHDPSTAPGSLVLVFSEARYNIVDKNLVQNIFESAVSQIGDLIQRVHPQDQDNIVPIAGRKRRA